MSRTPAAQRILGLGLGVVVLGLLVVLAVVLPRTGSSAGLELPDTIDGPVELTAIDRTEGTSGEEQEQAEQRDELFTSAGERLEEIFAADAVVRAYANEDQSAQLTVSAIAVGAGPFAPGGPPIDPELLDLERYTTELVEVRDAVCAVYWQQPVPAGEEVPEGDPAGFQCQLGTDGQTWLVEGSGLSVEDAVSVLEDLAG